MLFYGEADLAWLEGSEIVDEVRARRSWLSTDYDTIAENIPGFSSQYSLQEFVEAYLIVTTKSLRAVTEPGTEHE